MPRHRLLSAAIALYTLTAVAACSHHQAPPAPHTLDFKLPDLSGTVHALSDYRGRWVLVNYWATWCQPCVDEIPELSAAAAEYGRADVVILGIDYEDLAPDKLYDFIHRHHVGYAVLRTDIDAAQALGPVLGLPTTYLVSPRGRLVSTVLGPITRTGVEHLIDGEARRLGLQPPPIHPPRQGELPWTSASAS